MHAYYCSDNLSLLLKIFRFSNNPLIVNDLLDIFDLNHDIGKSMPPT